MSHRTTRPLHRRWPSLGATYDGEGTFFALWAEGAEAVELCLVDDAGEHRIPLDATSHVWSGYVPGVGPGQRYGYRVRGSWDPRHGHRWNAAKLLADPYSRAFDGAYVLDDAVFGHVHGREDTVRDDRDSAPFVPRSVVVDDAFTWGDDRRPAVPWEDTVVYETHVKGFTARHPGVPPALRGTYAGLAHPAAVQHLVDLGVTTVELMPVHQFVSEEHLLRAGLTNYWGYNSLGFFAPHAAYSSSGTRGEQVHEFKAMVRTLHAAGIEVVLDVVYNHSAEGGEHGPTLSFRGIGNRAYYRLREHGRRYADDTGCGNTLDLRHPQVLRVVMDSLRYWATEMHVDGFRFDLAAALGRGPRGIDMRSPFFAAVAQDPVLGRLKLIAEPWDVGEGGYRLGQFPPPWSEWNDRYRDTVRDFWRGAGHSRRDLATRLSGSADLYRGQDRPPSTSVNFVTAHDGFTLRDLVSYQHKHNEDNLEDNRDGTDDNRSRNFGVEGPADDPAVEERRVRQARNLLATLLLSAGVPMLLAGDELGRTQRGNNNAYCQDNALSWLDWQPAGPWGGLAAFTRRLLRLRHENPVFRPRRYADGRPVRGQAKDLAWFEADGQEVTAEGWADPEARTLGVFLSGHGRQAQGVPEGSDSFLVLLHAGEQPTTFRLPGEPWSAAYRVELATATDEAGYCYAGWTTVELPAGSVIVLRATAAVSG